MKYQRRKYIVDSGFQWRFVIGFIAAALVGNAAAVAFFNFYSMKILEKLQWSVFLNARSTGEALKSLFIQANLLNLLFMSALLAITGVWMLRRMSGPIYRIIKDLKQILNGSFSTEIALRKKDEFKDVAAALDEMREKTRERFSELGKGQQEISKALIELEIAHSKGSPVNEKIDRIITMVRNEKKEILPIRIE